MAPILQTNNIKRYYKSGGEIVKAVDGISISIEPGQLVVFQGPSGSGKTTLINLLGALDYPTGGKVFFKDLDLTNIGEKARNELRRTKFGFVFQSIALISLMSAYENVEFGLRIANVPRSERRKRAEEALKFVGLQNRMRHRPFELSGGEQQRVAIARAFSHKPEVIFADEPTAELDSVMGMQVMKVFRNLIEKEGITIVMTTHDKAILEIADKIYNLEDGKIKN